MICTLDVSFTTHLKEALINAHYKACADGHPLEFPTPASIVENYNVVVYEQGTLLTKAITFVEDGFEEFKKAPEKGEMLAFYKHVMPDIAGDNCGVWYRNLQIPKDTKIEDANCCMIYKKVPNDMVTICSTH